MTGSRSHFIKRVSVASSFVESDALMSAARVLKELAADLEREADTFNPHGSGPVPIEARQDG